MQTIVPHVRIQMAMHFQTELHAVWRLEMWKFGDDSIAKHLEMVSQLCHTGGLLTGTMMLTPQKSWLQCKE